MLQSAQLRPPLLQEPTHALQSGGTLLQGPAVVVPAAQGAVTLLLAMIGQSVLLRGADRSNDHVYDHSIRAGHRARSTLPRWQMLAHNNGGEAALCRAM